MRYTSEIKVGILTLIGIALFVWIMFALTKTTFKDEGYELRVIFPNIIGLQEKDAVRLSGMKVGEVEKIYLRKDNKVCAVLKIRPNITIREDAIFIITTESLLGIDKFVGIIPQSDTARVLKDKDTVIGQAPIEVREIIHGIKETLDKTSKLSDSIDSILQDKDFVASVKKTVSNVSLASEQIAEFTSILKNATLENKDEINIIVNNLKDITKNIEETTLKVKKITEGEDLQDIIKSLKETTNKIESIATKLDNEIMNKETIESAKSTLKNIEQITGSVNKELVNIKNVKLSPYVEFAGGKTKNKTKYQTNVNIEIKNKNSPDTFLLGIQDIDNKDKLNLQVSRQFQNNIFLKGGIKEGNLLCGLDYLNKKRDFKTILDFLNPEEPRVDVSAYYQFKEKLYLFWKIEDVKERKDNFFGIKFEK